MSNPDAVPSMESADLANGEPGALDAIPPASGTTPTCPVEFTVGAETGARSVQLVGEFNAWSTDSHPMERSSAGFSVIVELPRSSRWRYKFLVDGERWENDPRASDYVANEFGGYDSVVHVE